MGTNPRGLWIEIVGIPGSGKTHLASALSARLSDNASVCSDSPYSGKGIARRASNWRNRGFIEWILALSVRLLSLYWYFRLQRAAATLSGVNKRYLKILARKKSQVMLSTRFRRCAFVIPDTSFSSVISQSSVDKTLLAGANWYPDVLIILDINPAVAYRRIKIRDRPGDKYSAMRFDEFVRFAEECRQRHSFLASEQANGNRRVICMPNRTLEDVARTCLDMHNNARAA